jgi:probable phosphoglycerate mutase
MSTILYITRHGETLWNTQGRMQGWNDSPLTDLGKQQAVWLAERLKDVKFDGIYSSPTGRAFKTAELVRRDRNIDIIDADELREICLGDWEGLDQQQLKDKYGEQLFNFWNRPDLYKNDTGESFEDVRKRTFAFIKKIVQAHSNQNILIVTHTMALKSLMSCIENKPVERIWDPPYIKQTSLTILEFDEDNIRIVMNADASHHKEFNNDPKAV